MVMVRESSGCLDHDARLGERALVAEAGDSHNTS